MSRLYYHDTGEWRAEHLRAGESLFLMENPAPLPAPMEDADAPDGWVARIMSIESDGTLPGAEQTVLLARAGAAMRVDGHQVLCGIKVLTDRSFISTSAAGQGYYLSLEELPKVEPLEGEAAYCARCSGEIPPGEDSVTCKCDAIFHQSDTSPCWTYGETCPICQAPTALNREPWTPAEL